MLPTGLAESRFVGGCGDFFRLRYGIAAHRKMLLYVGRVAFEKNIGFSEMLARLKDDQPQALLVVTGEGPAFAGAAGAGQRTRAGRVRSLHQLPPDRHTELHDCYPGRGCVVFASRTETLGPGAAGSHGPRHAPAVALAEMGTCDIPGRGERLSHRPADAKALPG